MLVAEKHKKLVLNLREPERVLGIIPNARALDYKGKTLVAVPHTVDVARVLGNLGMDAPSPILHYYDWPGVYPPFTHQRTTAGFCTLSPRAFVLNGMGSGKTISVLWAAHYLLKLGIIDWVCVVSPLSTLERAWGDEIFRNFADLSFSILHGTSERRLKLAAQPKDIYVVNHDGLKNKQLLHALCTKPGNGLILIDELATFRNAGVERWKSVNRLVNGDRKLGYKPREWAWGLTGTPVPNEPTDAWAQVRLINPGNVPPYFGAFRDLVMRQISQYKWQARDNAMETVYKVMQPAIRFAREDCIDLPPTTYVTRDVELTKEQTTLYRDMMTKLKAEYSGGKITALNEAVKLGKLLQIVCGVAYGPEGEMTIPAQPRIDDVIETVHAAGAKVICFVPLTGALNAVATALAQEFEVAVIHGGVSKTQRDQIFADFQSPHGPRVLVAQPGTMSHGLSLVAADTIIWYAPTNSSETYQQANMRIVRPGQKNNTLIVRLQGSPVEQKMWARLDKREDAQGILLDLFA